MSIEPRIQYARSADGVNIAYSTAGEGNLLPVLWLPSMPVNHAQLTWKFQLRPYFDAIAAKRPFAMIDYRGQGLSDRDPPDISLAAIHRDIEAVLARLEWNRCALAGLFSGAAIALSFAQQHPERVARLVLLGPRTPGSHAGRDADGGLAALLETNWDMYVDAVAHQVYGWDEPDLAREFVIYLRQSATQESAQAMLRAAGEVDLDAALDAVDAPALVLHGEGMSYFSLDVARAVAARLRNARLGTFVIPSGSQFAGGVPFVERFLDEEETDTRASAPMPVTANAAGTRTVLFTDIVGHTEMMQRLGDAKGRDVLREHERITRETLKAHGGTEVKTMGDGFLASFGSVTSAMECAIAMQRAFATHTELMPEPLHVRVGLNAGEPIEEDGDLFGATVILASRIAAKAGAGEILVPDTVRGLLSGKGFVFGDRGQFVPKGFDEGVRLWDVQWRE
jgi:class 3 adenylate cyclase/pimeloyl-ACP methyl ester carboxylesterase